MAYLTRVPYCEVTVDPFLEHGALGGPIGDTAKPATEQWTVNKPEHEACMLTTAAGIAADSSTWLEDPGWKHDDNYAAVTIACSPAVDPRPQGIRDRIPIKMAATYFPTKSTCEVLSLALSQQVTYTAYRLEAWDADRPNPEQCTPGQDCAGGWCRFESEPASEQVPGGRFLWGAFKNWSDELQRGTRFTAYFQTE